MAFNGQTKFSKISSSQNYTNILYTDSDSDNVPDLKLPPVKGRKHKRRKGSSGKHDSPVCSFWTVLKLVTAIIAFVVLVILAAVSFWTFRQISKLQQQIVAFEESDKVTSEVTKLQSQLMDVNVTVTGVKTSLSSLQQIRDTITDLQSKLVELEQANKKLQESVSAAKDLLDMPSKFNMLSESVAKMGSDILLVKGTATQKSDDFEKRIAALEITVRERSKNSSSSVDNQKLTSLNDSLSSGLHSLQQELEQQSTRVTVLEDFTKHQPEGFKSEQNSTWVTELVTMLVQEKLSNLTTGSQSGSNGSQALLANNPLENAQFLAFKADIMGNFELINETVSALSSELEEVASHLASHDSAIINMTVAISSLQNKEGTTVQEHNEVVSTSPASTREEVSPSVVTSGSASQAGLNGVTGDMKQDVIHIDGINSWEDLHKAFQRGWPVENGQLDVDALNDLGSSGIDKDAIKRFDSDGNGLYSEDEMALALGFHHNPR